MLVPPLHFCANGSASGLCQEKEFRCINGHPGHLSFLSATCTQKPEVWCQFITNDNKSEAVQAKKKKKTRKNGWKEKGKKRKNSYPLTSFTTGCPSFMSCTHENLARLGTSGNKTMLSESITFSFFLVMGRFFLLVLHLLRI